MYADTFCFFAFSNQQFMKYFLFIVFVLVIQCTLSAQSVSIIDSRTQKPLSEAFAISESNEILEADINGTIDFKITNLELSWTIHCMSYQSIQYSPSSGIDEIRLKLDPLKISELLVVEQKLPFCCRTIGCGIIISAQLSPTENNVTGTPSELSKLTGLFVDASQGEIFSKVHTRGIAASAEDDIGWYYTSLQEDGLPMTAIQYNYFTPDMYYRSDLMTEQVQFTNGGTAAILHQNAPGGAVNYISQRLSNKNHGSVKLSTGLEGKLRPYSRVDGMYNAHFDTKNITLAVGGFFRQADGPRETQYAWAQGGQFTMKAQKVYKKGILKLSYKYLNDHVNRYTGVTATNWSNPQAAYDQNLNYTALLLPYVDAKIPGGKDFNINDQTGSFSFDPSQGIHVKEQALRMDLSHKLNNWDINLATKISSKKADWQTSFSNARLGLDNYLSYFISGAESPFGQVTFKDAVTKEILAVVNNNGAAGPFMGEEASFEYLYGSLPNDAIMGIAPWKKQDKLNETILQLQAQRELDKHTLSIGLFSSSSKLDYFSNASFAYTTYEALPRYLVASVIDNDGNEYELSDANGLSNYGALFFENGAINSKQLGLFTNDQYQLSKSWNVDLGIRYQLVQYDGQLVSPQGISEMNSDFDRDANTVYDQNILVPSNNTVDFDHTYQSLSWSVGIEHQMDQSSIFAKASQNHKAPELNYYINNFSGESIPDKSPVQNIKQLEIGAKYLGNQWSVNATSFLSHLSNIPLSGFDQDDNSGEIFYTQVQLNSSTTVGLELEWALLINKNWKFAANHTLQSSKANKYTIVNTNGTQGTEDDMAIDYNGSTLPNVPSLMSHFNLEYARKNMSSYITYNLMGKRYGNIENSFDLPAYHTFDIGFAYTLRTNIHLGLMVNNLLNSAGLANFFGPNNFGSNANDATKEYILNNPQGEFVVFPIIPRTAYITVKYDF